MNRISKLFAISVLATLMLIVGCSDDSTGPSGPGPYDAITLSLFSAATLEPGYHYKIWAARSDESLSSSAVVNWTVLGEFNVRNGGLNNDGEALPDTITTRSNVPIEDGTFGNLGVDLDDYDSLFITIESSSGSGLTPSATVYLKCEIPDSLDESSVRGLEFAEEINIGTNSFVLATPTDAVADNDLSGIWFYRNIDNETPGLDLDPAPPGWRWEGWVRHDGIWLSIGRFTNPQASDDFDGYSSSDNPTPDVPGEDFLNNPPAGVTFPWIISAGDSVAVTLEPDPYSGTGLFRIRALQAYLQADPSPRALIFLGRPTDSQGHTVSYFPAGNAWYRRSEDL